MNVFQGVDYFYLHPMFRCAVSGRSMKEDEYTGVSVWCIGTFVFGEKSATREVPKSVRGTKGMGLEVDP